MQIGPRIRVGGSVGKVGQELKIGAGKVAKVAAPVVSFINPAIGAGLAAAGTALDTSHGAVNPLDVAKAGLLNYGSGKLLGSAVRAIPGASKFGDVIQSGISKIPGGSRAVDLYHSIQGATNSDPIGDAVKRRLGTGDTTGAPSAAGAAGGGTNGGGPSLMDQLILGGSVAANTADALRRRQMQDKAANYATGAYDARAPLRARALKLLQNPVTPDDSSIFADPGNVYARPQRPRAAALMAGAA